MFTAIVFAFRFTPAAAVVLTTPLSVVVPLPAVCTRLAADSVVAVTLAALVIVTAPSGVTPPTTPAKLMSPVPAVSPSVWPPLSVPANVMFPIPAPVEIATGPVSVVLLL